MVLHAAVCRILPKGGVDTMGAEKWQMIDAQIRAELAASAPVDRAIWEQLAKDALAVPGVQWEELDRAIISGALMFPDNPLARILVGNK